MLMLLLACGKSPDVFVAAAAQAPKELGTVGLAAPMFLQDTSETPFDDGVYVGNIVLSGGYVVTERGDYGMQTHSKEITLSGEDTYRTLSHDTVSQMFETSLTESGTTWLAVEVVGGTPERRKLRGSHAEDGTDNVNLPRFTLSPSAIEPVEGVDHVLVPYVVRYYSHNAGWFYGQEKGCGAGARLRVLWVLHDADSGGVAAWRDIDVRHIDPYLFSPSSAEIEDGLIEVETLLRRDLDRHLF